MDMQSQADTGDLFSPVKLGALTLSNRIVMAPLTRSRAGAGGAPRRDERHATTPSAPRPALS